MEFLDELKSEFLKKFLQNLRKEEQIAAGSSIGTPDVIPEGTHIRIFEESPE